MYEYIDEFKMLGFGLFSHFGLYSVLGKGEWYRHMGKMSPEKYDELAKRFNPSKNWAKDLVKTAKLAGCKYINLTTRHHDGFSLYDTKGLSDFDAPSFCGRDLVREFVDACNEQNIVPFFYHTLLDWHVKEYENDFPKYIDYLVASVEILCKNYGKVGGFWFDGFWDKPEADWQFDRLYKTIRKYQPNAIIVNNTGLSALGEVSHPEIDCVTFERGKPTKVDCSDKNRAGEMCQVIFDHWGYAKNDICGKSPVELIENLIDCRKYGCNFLLNAGPKGDGKIGTFEKECLKYIGKWIKVNKNFIYSMPSETVCENADAFFDGKYYYAVIKKVPMESDENVTRKEDRKYVKVLTDKKIKNAVWLDNGKKIENVQNNGFYVEPFSYGESYSARVARFTLK